MDEKVKEILDSYIKERGAAPLYLEILAEYNPDALKDWYSFRKRIFEEGVIPRKYKELFVMSMCFARLYPGGEAHMKAAIEYGATKEEIFEAILLTIPGVGVPAFSTATRALKNLGKNVKK
jgi:alkylhydroperoxidase/carboxymuconolactone decarboxylase family protein YurZ